MTRTQITDLLAMHEQSAAILREILQHKQDILTAQDNLVLIEKNPNFTARVKHHLTDTGLDYIGSIRTLIGMQSEQYAVLAQKLAEPFVPKESYLVTTHEIVTV